MKYEATPEQQAMARRIARETFPPPDEAIRRDGAYRGALAAIIETTAQVEILEIVLPGFGVGLADGASIAKRQIVDHLKGQDHG